MTQPMVTMAVGGVVDAGEGMMGRVHALEPLEGCA